MKPNPDTPSIQLVPTRPFEHRVAHLEDTISDPAMNDLLGQDWAGEGGALLTGPVNSKKTRRRKHNKTNA